MNAFLRLYLLLQISLQIQHCIELSCGDHRVFMLEPQTIELLLHVRSVYSLSAKLYKYFLNITVSQVFTRQGCSEYQKAVSTTRPEKCDIFAQRYQSQPITTRFQKHCLYFFNLQKPWQNILNVVYRTTLSIRTERTDKQ